MCAVNERFLAKTGGLESLVSFHWEELYESILSKKIQSVLISKVSDNKIPKIVNLQKKSVEWQKITLHHY